MSRVVQNIDDIYIIHLSLCSKKEYQEYASITRSKSQKLFAHLRPNGQQNLQNQTRKEEEEYLEASRQEAKQRDIVHGLEEEIAKLEKMVSNRLAQQLPRHPQLTIHNLVRGI